MPRPRPRRGFKGFARDAWRSVQEQAERNAVAAAGWTEGFPAIVDSVPRAPPEGEALPPDPWSGRPCASIREQRQPRHDGGKPQGGLEPAAAPAGPVDAVVNAVAARCVSIHAPAWGGDTFRGYYSIPPP